MEMEKLDYQINETWKPIPGYPNHWVSTQGQIKNIKTNRLLSPYRASNGYLQVSISGNGKTISKCIHRLVVETFLGKRPGGFETNHIDSNKENNNLLNLEYIPYKDNRQKRTVFIFCVICGKLINASNKDRKTCSKKCYQKRHFIKLVCTNCSKSFWRRKSHYFHFNIKRYPSKGNNVFCSNHCQGVWFGKKFGRQRNHD